MTASSGDPVTVYTPSSGRRKRFPVHEAGGVVVIFMRGSTLVYVVGIPFCEDGLECEEVAYQREAVRLRFPRIEWGADRVPSWRHVAS